jgi:signal transduction histidine kinase
MQLARWNREAPYPRLIREILLARPDGNLETLRPEAGKFEPRPWPGELHRLRRRFSEPRYFWRGTGVEADPPSLISAQTMPDGSLERLVVWLDERVITREILPGLTRRHFGTIRGGDYALAVVDAEHPENVIFRSDPDLPAGAFRSPEIRRDFFGLVPFKGNGAAILKSSRNREPKGSWQLLVRHRDGTLEEAVDRLRRRNLALGAGILGLLTGTAVLMVLTTQRAQRLARQQMEFVAAVSHELNTPLGAMRTAAQNLAAGIVKEPAQVQRYGALIEGEGRRLTDMVAQTLELAGIQSGRKVYRPEPVAVAEVLDGALESCRGMLEEKEIEVETDVPPGLPPALADGAALRRAVQNLVENAAKHGGRGGWIGLRARNEPSGGIQITVTDRGPGIPDEDLPHVFEPFYRGRAAVEQSVPGSGLGLDLVRKIAQAHGGNVSVSPGESGRGSVFTLRMPAAREESA